jgi:hypothetical protein
MGLAPFFIGREGQYAAYVTQNSICASGGKKRLMGTIMEKDENPNGQTACHDGKAKG